MSSLAKAINALLDFVAAHEAIPRDQNPQTDVSRFEALYRKVYAEARKLDLHGKLSPPDDCDFSGKTRLLACDESIYEIRGPFSITEDDSELGDSAEVPFPPLVTSRWHDHMLDLRALADAMKAQRPGRPSKKENPAETKIIAALTFLLKKRGRDDPPKGKDVIEKSGVKNVSRFMRKHWGTHQQFAAAWNRGVVGAKLAEIQGYVPEQHEEYNDEQPPSTKGHRRRGHAPGSGHYED